MDATLVDKWSAIITASTWLFSWVLFWSYTNDPIGSCFAAAIAAGLVFLAYIVFRMLLLTFRR